MTDMVTVRIGGSLVPVRLPENTAEAKRQADRAEAAADAAAASAAEAGGAAGTAIVKVRDEMRRRFVPTDRDYIDIQQIGLTSTVTGSSLAQNVTYVFDDPVARKGPSRYVTIDVNTPGDIEVSQWRYVGGDKVQQAATTITLPEAGARKTFDMFEDFPGLEFEEGDFAGFFQISARIPFVTSSGGTPYHAIATHVTSFTPGTPNTSNRLGICFGIAGEKAPIADTRDEIDAMVELIEASGGIAKQMIGTAVPVDGSFLALGRTYILNRQATAKGFLRALPFYAKEVGYAYVPIWKADWTFKGMVRVDYKATGAQRKRAWRDFGKVAIDPGDRFGICPMKGRIAVTLNTANDTPYWNPLGLVTTGYNPGATSPTTAHRMEFGIELMTEAEATGLEAATILTLPPVIYGVQGRQVNIYWDNLIYGNGLDFAWDVQVTTRGSQQDERWYWAINAAVDEDMDIVLIDPISDKELDRATTRLKTVTYPPASPKAFTALVFGDSLPSTGEITQELLNLAGAGGSNTTLTLIGTRGSGANRHEGRGGMKAQDFATAGRTDQLFNVSGVVVEPLVNTSTVYTHNSRTYTPQTVSLTGGSGTMICSYSGGSAPDASGTLTKSGDGPGDATIAFSSTTPVSGDPWWDNVNAQIDIPGYLSANSFATPNFVIPILGINGINNQPNDAAVDAAIAAELGYYETVVQAWLDVDPDLMVFPTLTTRGAAFQSAAGANYGSTIPMKGAKRNLLRMAKAMIDHFGGREAERIYLAPTNIWIDPVHGYPWADQNANSRSTEPVRRWTNLYHPSLSGKQQMADCLYSMMHVLGA
ncbi:hypothetical protein V6U71_21430 [Sphingopyxis sp. J-6]|uniref:hypothetical protein n=1 Tax=Sphingopyxis sp. J-6 TaxID=3122054 RepID=UPI0039845033